MQCIYFLYTGMFLFAVVGRHQNKYYGLTKVLQYCSGGMVFRI